MRHNLDIQDKKILTLTTRYEFELELLEYEANFFVRESPETFKRCQILFEATEGPRMTLKSNNHLIATGPFGEKRLDSYLFISKDVGVLVYGGFEKVEGIELFLKQEWTISLPQEPQ